MALDRLSHFSEETKNSELYRYTEPDSSTLSLPSPSVTQNVKSKPVQLPQCRACKKTLNTTLDRQKTRDKWWVNCQSCRTMNTAERRRKKALALDRYAGPRPPSTLNKVKPVPMDIYSIPDEPSTASLYNHYRKASLTDKMLKLSEAADSDFRQVPTATKIPRKSPLKTVQRWDISSLTLRKPCRLAVPQVKNKVDHSSRPVGISKRINRQIYVGEYGVWPQANPQRVKGSIPKNPECSVCAGTFPVTHFPKLSSCTHTPDVCTDCFLGWLNSQLESTSWEKIQCPFSCCDRQITHEDVKTYAPNDLFTRYGPYHRQ
jgi:hypothetical protein